MRIAGYQSDEVIGRNCRFLQGPDTDPQAIAQIRRAIAERKEFKTSLLNYRKDGQPFWNELKIAPVFSEEGDLIYFSEGTVGYEKHPDCDPQWFIAR